MKVTVVTQLAWGHCINCPAEKKHVVLIEFRSSNIRLCKECTKDLTDQLRYKIHSKSLD